MWWTEDPNMKNKKFADLSDDIKKILHWNSAGDSIVEPIGVIDRGRVISIGAGFWNGMGVFTPSYYNMTDYFNNLFTFGQKAKDVEAPVKRRLDGSTNLIEDKTCPKT